jgi:hypothetical protein
MKRLSLGILLLWGVLAPDVQAFPPIEKLRDRLKNSPVASAFRKELLSSVAFYPDEVIAAIFTVGRDYEALTQGQSSVPETAQALALLAEEPAILADLREHPLATRALGQFAANDPQLTWETIDQLRAEYRSKSGQPVAQAVVAEAPPPALVYVPPQVTGDGSTTVDAAQGSVVIAPNVTVVESVTPAYVTGYTSSVVTTPVTGVVAGSGTTPVGGQGAAAYGTVQGENASAAGYGVAVAGENAAHIGAGGVVVNDEGQVKAGSAGATVIDTQNGAVAVGHAGQTNIDTQAGTVSSSHTAGAVNSQGEGVVVHQEGSGSFDSNSYQRTGQGSVQATNGQGANWTHQGSGEVSETGASHQSSTHVETNAGQSADVEHSTSVDKTDTGVDVDHGGSVTTGAGQSYEWGNRDEAANQRSTAGSSPPRAGGSAEAWNFFSGQSNAPATASKAASRFARSGEAMKSAEAFSGKGLDSKQLNKALKHGKQQQSRTFKSVEPKLGAMGGQPLFQDQPMRGPGGGGPPAGHRRGGGGGGGGRRR